MAKARHRANRRSRRQETPLPVRILAFITITMLTLLGVGTLAALIYTFLKNPIGILCGAAVIALIVASLIIHDNRAEREKRPSSYDDI